MSVKLCECGCGNPAPIASMTSRRKGWIKGQPKRFLHGHTGGTQRRAYTVDPQSGCWNFDGHIRRIGRAGSVRVVIDGQPKFIAAYRYYYEQARGPIPVGLVLDHTCRNPRCVNPDHLEPVTQAENLKRAGVQHGADGKFQRRAS